MVEFRQINLTETFAPMPPMDIIFLRNVLIYFDVETKREILARVRQVLQPDGYLFLGGGETTVNLDDAFEPVQFDKTVCYRLRWLLVVLMFATKLNRKVGIASKRFHNSANRQIRQCPPHRLFIYSKTVWFQSGISASSPPMPIAVLKISASVISKLSIDAPYTLAS